MLPPMGPRNSSFPVRSLSFLSLVAVAALASGCVSYSRPYGHYGGYGGHHGSGGCRGSYGCGGGHGYTETYRRYETVYVPVYRNVPRHSYDGRNRHWERGWADDDHRRDRDRNHDQGRDRNRNDDRRVGPPPQAQPQPQPPQRQRMATPRAESPRARDERKPVKLEDWRAERARRGQAATGNGRSSWREARERP